MFDPANITEEEALALDRALKLLRKQVPTGGAWRGTYGELLTELKREAYSQEKFGARRMAGVLDAAHNVILAGFTEKQERSFFRNRGK